MPVYRGKSGQREAEMDYSDYFSGRKLYGDDFSIDDIRKWYEDEENGYYELIHNQFFKDIEYTYGYHALNEAHGYRHVRGRHYRRALAFGCANGDDVEPLASNVDEFVAIEPAEKWWRPEIGGKPARYIKPVVHGDIPLTSGEIDLTICLGVLHHIPNVTHVINEISRISAKGAVFVLREPISTMGDWRKPRIGLTRNERGFPLAWLDDRLRQAGFEIERRTLCMFPLTPKIAKLFGVDSYQNKNIVLMDKLISQALEWNYHYYRNSAWKKICGGSAFYVLKKT